MPPISTATEALSPQQLAKYVHLRYVTDGEAGFTREHHGKTFAYRDHQGRAVRSATTLDRFSQLAIPPAWQDVWICRSVTGHLQATGRDIRKRKQYRYHAKWSEAANVAKFWRLRAFGELLPKLRRQVGKRLAGNLLDRERALAGIVALLDATSIRIGNEEYVKQNNSFGLTTLRDRHVTVGKSQVELRFTGKSGLKKELTITDKPLVRFIKQAREVTGTRLFQFHNESQRRSITATMVNTFMQQLTGTTFTAKDFRTWKASALVAAHLFKHRRLKDDRGRKAEVKSAISAAAESLTNTATVCRNYYIHPALAETFLDGSFSAHFRGFHFASRRNFGRDEQILSHFLATWQKRQGANKS